MLQTEPARDGMKSAHLSADLLVGIGDIHGHYPALHALINGLNRTYDLFSDMETLKLRGDAEIVFTGDYIDRGSQNLRVIEAQMRLKDSNPENVHQLFGNHELLALADLDVARRILREWSLFYGRRMLEDYHYMSAHGCIGGGAFLKEFIENDDERAGFEAYIHAMEHGSPIGDWIRSLEAMRLVRIHGHSVLFVHGGIPFYIRDRVELRRYFGEFTVYMAQSTATFGSSREKYDCYLTDDHSIFWDRRVPRIQKEQLEQMLDDLNVDYLVIGHTPQDRIVNYHDRFQYRRRHDTGVRRK